MCKLSITYYRCDTCEKQLFHTCVSYRECPDHREGVTQTTRADRAKKLQDQWLKGLDGERLDVLDISLAGADSLIFHVAPKSGSLHPFKRTDKDFTLWPRRRCLEQNSTPFDWTCCSCLAKPADNVTVAPGNYSGFEKLNAVKRGKLYGQQAVAESRGRKEVYSQNSTAHGRSDRPSGKQMSEYRPAPSEASYQRSAAYEEPSGTRGRQKYEYERPSSKASHQHSTTYSKSRASGHESESRYPAPPPYDDDCRAPTEAKYQDSVYNGRSKEPPPYVEDCVMRLKKPIQGKTEYDQVIETKTKNSNFAHGIHRLRGEYAHEKGIALSSRGSDCGGYP